MIKKDYFFSVPISIASESEILEFILDFLKKKEDSLFITTPNPEIVVYAQTHKDFQEILLQSDIAIPDGTGLVLAAKLLGKSMKHRITGVDLMEKICEKVVNRPVTVGLLGGKGQVADKTAECLRKKYPGLHISFANEEWEEGTVVDILFVAFGFPKQEQWLFAHRDKKAFHIGMGVGGAFDYISGTVPRSPLVVQRMGMEWLFRLLVQPWRIKRQLALLEFVRMCMFRWVSERIKKGK